MIGPIQVARDFILKRAIAAIEPCPHLCRITAHRLVDHPAVARSFHGPGGRDINLAQIAAFYEICADGLGATISDEDVEAVAIQIDLTCRPAAHVKAGPIAGRKYEDQQGSPAHDPLSEQG